MKNPEKKYTKDLRSLRQDLLEKEALSGSVEALEEVKYRENLSGYEDGYANAEAINLYCSTLDH